MDIILNWVKQNIAESLAIFISLFSVTISIVLNRREKPNIMPYGQNMFDNHLIKRIEKIIQIYAIN